MFERKMADSRQFETLMLPHLDALYRTAFYLTRSSEEAEDLTQETYLRAYRAFDTWRGGHVKAWLFAILRHAWLDSYRSQRRSPSLMTLDTLEAPGQNGVSAQAGHGDTLEDQVFAALVDEDVEHALTSLPVEWRLAVVLADVEDFTYQEIADITQAPIGTVMSRLHRARRRLAEMLKAYAHRAGYETE